MLDTYLHLTESYTNLLKAVQSEEVRASLSRVVTILISRFLRENGSWYQELSREWKCTEDLSDRYGDDAEGCWMILEAAQVLNNKEVSIQVEQAAKKLADNLITVGYDEDNGGVFDRLQSDGTMSKNKLWWEESESTIAMLYAYHLTGEMKFAEKAIRTWNFIRDHICTETGGWNWLVTPEGELIPTNDPADPLMCPYHSIRIVTHCTTVIHRIQSGS